MIDDSVLGQYINTVFMPYVPLVGGVVIAIIIVLLVMYLFNENFLD